jgi:hypothetical protein
MKLRHLAGTVFIILIIGMTIYLSKTSEGFANRCGVDLPSCSGERIRCMNGYCKSDIPNKLPPISDLQMTPATKYIYS